MFRRVTSAILICALLAPLFPFSARAEASQSEPFLSEAAVVGLESRLGALGLAIHPSPMQVERTPEGVTRIYGIERVGAAPSATGSLLPVAVMILEKDGAFASATTLWAGDPSHGTAMSFETTLAAYPDRSLWFAVGPDPGDGRGPRVDLTSIDNLSGAITEIGYVEARGAGEPEVVLSPLLRNPGCVWNCIKASFVAIGYWKLVWLVACLVVAGMMLSVPGAPAALWPFLKGCFLVGNIASVPLQLTAIGVCIYNGCF